MKLLLLSLFFAVCWCRSANNCLYTVNDLVFDLSPARGLQLTHKSGNISWALSLCGGLQKTGCDESSAVCIVNGNAKPMNYANASTAFATSGSTQYLTLFLVGGDECAPGQKRKAKFNIACTDSDEDTVTVDYAEQFTCIATVSMSSRFGCGIKPTDNDGGLMYVPGNSYVAPVLILIISALGCCCIFLLACICCNRKKITKQGYQQLQSHENSNSVQMRSITHSPVSVTNQTAPPPQLQVPQYLMQVPLQQQQFPGFYPMYPAVQFPNQFQAPAPIPVAAAPQIRPAIATDSSIAKQEDQLDDDEKLARELQAQFDSEAQV